MLCLVDKLETYQDEEMKDRAENDLESRDAWGAISKEAHTFRIVECRISSENEWLHLKFCT